ncbi:M48 family metalloprotease [Cohnella sp. CFH 77786]|uniref:M56 family metallopeptidase n=1 Tax=Cohnella sp. CFH 77786 TaxID=2662265 RepID=UPI001C61023D|nr:M56 family metallopeptidase [Cohnella sp. CFH 77786]MBW5448833.1 M48 family metalloprotease [Cohnella sp. CFH 77786]
MNPPVKLRLIYALTVAFAVLAIWKMAALAVHQSGNGSDRVVTVTYAVFDVMIGCTLCRAVWRLLAQFYLSRKWLKRYRLGKHAKLTKRLHSAYRSWGTEMIVVRDDAFVALTLGMLRPKIVISTAVLRMFSKDEVKAILLHEWYHCRNRDNAKLFLLTLLSDAFVYCPIVRSVLTYYRTWNELLADRFAIRRMGTELHLGSVLLKLSKCSNLRHVAAAVHFTDTTMHYRIQQVLEPDKPVNVRIDWLRPLLLSCSLLLLLALGGDS